ncbi:hypothetical protein GGI25_002069 [Coemansia spiralis]|uniref:RRM domain-containing protein n=2 Tax=Coemansia TaxID=4863 RepID=A0A9W8KZC5_9FUNG|nr:hypothetical protein BX070DRAFT_232315 [Coemansia spiralis]KAJ1988858.1 hypothetical protein EDC05_005018 [Coemansia umbellata]KAJ2619967.1 hypothetical protein GGI26_005420 [Coemansia sp. RSA 1358]KAJ2678685.1 hypothetical protein GGI25_002069 [Coemansia spiralis]
MSTTLELTKKQRKALQFRGKLEKPSKEERTKVPEANKKSKKSKDRVSNNASAEKQISENAKPSEKVKFEKQTSATGQTVRFIAFVGNLPFKTTAEELKAFMRSANPTSVRLMTNKDTGKSRGFAFVEFATSTDLKHALKFHHMRLDTKKINVELTAGGGGNSEQRKQKIKRRREELDEERKKDNSAKRQKHENTDNADGDSNNGDNEQRTQKRDQKPEPVDIDRYAEDNNGNNQTIEDYDVGSSKEKKSNRRKRGRGQRK